MKKIFTIGMMLIVSIQYISAQNGNDSSSVKVNKIKDLVIYDDTLFYSSFPSVIKRADGELLLAFRRAPDRRLFGDTIIHCDLNSYLVMMRSHDGETWDKEPELLYAYPFGGSQDPCLLQLTDGTLLCTSYVWTHRARSQRDLSRPYSEYAFMGGYYVRSTDGGQHWHGPFYPPPLPQETLRSPLGNIIPACNRGALCEGKNGRIYWAVIASGDKTSVHLLTSDDKGLTWNYSGVIAADAKFTFNETSVYETPEGDIVAFIRTDGMDDMACISRSKDGGKTFEWESMAFQGHPLNALKLPDNRVVLTYGYRQQPYGIRMRVLNAECTDFATAEEFVIRDDAGNEDIGYTWPVLLDNNKVLVTYYFNKNNTTRYIAGTIIEIK